MHRKNRQSYESTFRILKEEVHHKFQRELNPSFISTDYELVVMNVVKAEFPQTKILGCFFHLAQSFWRRLQSEGLAESYEREENEDLRAYFHSLRPYIPCICA